MQNNAKSLLLIHRENYNVPEGQEQSVHCKIAKLDSADNIIEGCRIVRFGAKKFDTGIKDNLETMGYTIEILYHPLAKYSNVVIRDKDVEMAEKDNEIARLYAELAELRAKTEPLAEPIQEAIEPKTDEPKAEEKNKGGRPRKEK